VPVGGTAGQFLTKIDGTNYNTDWTTVNLSQYAVKANNLSDLASASTARTNLGLGTMATATAADYSTTTVANGLYYPLSGNPSAFLTSSALSPYLLSATAASTYAPIAAGQPTSGTVGQVLTKNSGTNYDSSWATLIPGDRYLTSSTTSLSVTNGAKTLTVGTGLSYSSQQDIVISYDATHHMHAQVLTYNSGTGQLDVDVLSHTGTGTFSAWTVNVGGTTPLQSVYWGEILGTLGDQSDLATALNSKLETSTAASTYAALAGAVFTGEVSTPASTTVTAGLSILPGVAPTSPTNGEFWNTGSDLQVRLGGVTETLAEQSWVTSQGYLTSSALTPYLTSATAASTYQTLSGMSSYLTTSAASTTYAALAGATFTGLVNTLASSTSGPGFRLPHGAAPTTLTDGDVWSTTTGLFMRVSGVTRQYVDFDGTQTINGSKTFSNASQTLGNSTATGTINVASGATLSGSTKTLNIGTSGVSGSTTLTTIGPVLGASTTSIGNTTAASTLNLATGATLTATTKAINIGTAGVSGSTTTIAVGSATSTTTTTIEGTVTANGAALNLGTSTAAATYNLGTGATLTATTKAVNIGTNGVAGSTTNIAIGSTTGTSTTTLQGAVSASGISLDLGTSAASATYAFGGGSTTTGLTKTINIGTGGGGGSTTNITLGTSSGTSTAQIYGLSLPGGGTTTTAAVDNNSTTIASTAYVVGQAGSATPIVDGTAAVGTSLRYARQDHVHPTDTSRAPLASPTFTGTVTIPAGASISGFAPLASPSLTGTPLSTTAAVDTNTTQIATTAFVVGQGYAKLASPTFTGTPTLPTGTIATTQTAGNNTTAVATTAFVTAAVPAFASEAQALACVSTTTALNPLQIRNLLSNAGYTQYSSLIGNYSIYQSGTSGISVYSDYASPYVNVANGKIGFSPSSALNVNSMQGRGTAELVMNWTKPMWFSYRFHYGAAIGSDANTICRVTVGKTASTFGDLSSRGFGIKWDGSTTGVFSVMAHNGTTLSTVASSVSVSSTTYFPTNTSAADFLVYSDGAGNVTLYCNNVQIATTTGGPSSGSGAARFIFETDNTTSTTGICAPTYMGIRSFFAY
jgi:hypothetical protein